MEAIVRFIPLPVSPTGPTCRKSPGSVTDRRERESTRSRPLAKLQDRLNCNKLGNTCAAEHGVSSRWHGMGIILVLQCSAAPNVGWVQTFLNLPDLPPFSRLV
jgi:hypothetical protein